MIHDEIKKALATDAAGIHVSRDRMWELLREAESALASLSAPKPESAEAVVAATVVTMMGRDGEVGAPCVLLEPSYEAWLDQQPPSTSHRLYTAPPRPEASDDTLARVARITERLAADRSYSSGEAVEDLREALEDAARPEASDEVAELASRQQLLGREHGEILAAHLGEFLDDAPQQASAPVGVDGLRRMVEKLAAHVRPTCCELWEEAQAALAQQPAADSRSAHRVWRANDWLPCYCAATSDHHIGYEQPAAVDEADAARFRLMVAELFADDSGIQSAMDSPEALIEYLDLTLAGQQQGGA